MKLTAELSLYPLQSDYIPAIQAFIDAAREHDNIKNREQRHEHANLWRL